MPAESLRSRGEEADHIRLLAELHDELPPIVVHRSTMRVIDGMHRLKAARLRGAEAIAVAYFDGDDDEAFVLAVKANVQHGLPLSLSDRKAAAARIVRFSAHRSDRAIAEVAGLSPKTVGAIRRDSAVELTEVTKRVGLDGRLRPLNTVDGRRYASELIALNPQFSSREIGRRAGISPSTVRDVRERLRQGLDPVPTRRRAGTQARPAPRERKLQEQIRKVQSGTDVCRDEILHKLGRDPAIRLNDHGRAVLRWLNWQSSQVDKNWSLLADNLPPHCLCLLADLACSFAESWLELASEMQQRGSIQIQPGCTG